MVVDNLKVKTLIVFDNPKIKSLTLALKLDALKDLGNNTLILA